MRWTTSIGSAPNGSTGWVAGMRGGPSSRTPAHPPKIVGFECVARTRAHCTGQDDLVEVYAFLRNDCVEKEWVPPRGSRLPQEHRGDGEDHSVRCSSDPAEQSVGRTHTSLSTRTPPKREDSFVPTSIDLPTLEPVVASDNCSGSFGVDPSNCWLGVPTLSLLLQLLSCCLLGVTLV